jgi:hypothetical protein
VNRSAHILHAIILQKLPNMDEKNSLIQIKGLRDPAAG